jgi:uncharacterized protein
MGRLILFILIGFAIYYFFIKKPQVEEKENKSQNNTENTNNEELIMCDKCKTFYPKSEIKKINGKNICKECYENS